MVRVYVTKWVIARGILVGEAEKAHKRGNSINLYAEVSLPGLRHSYILSLGNEVFYTAEEAKQNAESRFKAHYQRSKRAYLYAKKALKEIEHGRGPRIHTRIKAVNKCRAF